MMKIFKLKFIGFLIAVSVIASCSIDNDKPYCFYTIQMPITAVTGPETATVEVPVTFVVTYKAGNDCGEFNRFGESASFPKNIAVFADFEGCECTPTPTATATAEYSFTATAAGTYELKFSQGSDLYISKTITVTE